MVWQQILLGTLLALLLLAGIASICHMFLCRRNRQSLPVIFNMMVLNVIGIALIIGHLILFAIDEYNPATATYARLLRYSFVSVNLSVMVFVWRAVYCSTLSPIHRVGVLVYFIASFVGFLSLKPDIAAQMIAPRDLPVVKFNTDTTTIVQSSITTYLIVLIIEYAIFYVPSFCVIVKLRCSAKLDPCDRSSTEDKVELRVCMDSQKPKDASQCPRCASISPFLDLSSICLGLALFVVRPLHVLYYWLRFSAIVDLENIFFVLPIYGAVCMLNFQTNMK